MSPLASAAPARTLGRGARAAAIISFVVILLAVAATPSFASEHTEVTGEYGKEGPKTTGVGNGCHLGYNESAGHLYLSSDNKIYGLAVTPGSATLLPGFPFSAVNSGCGDPDMEVDNSGNGNIYAVTSGSEIYGWHSNGTPIGGAFPISVTGGGETCGVDVTASGEVWGDNYSQSKIYKYSSTGAPEGSISLGFQSCKFAIDRSSGDIFAAKYGGGEIVKFTASSGYTEKIPFPSAGSGDPGLAVNGAEGKLYVGGGGENINVYDTSTGGLVETVPLGGFGGQGIAVDEGTDTLFATVGSGESGVIKEWLGLTTPKAITGEPVGNSGVTGTVNPNGVGPITECYFEYGLVTNAGYEHKQNCEQATPIAVEEAVSAQLPALIGEETYRYRLVVTNGEPHVIGRGGEKTITPHNVKGLTTEAATEVTASSATLNASFEGNGEDTTYYFEWGQSKRYGNVTPIEDAGSPASGVNHISTAITGLKPGVFYHYRVVGENGFGISKAGDKTFTTFELPAIESFTTSNLSNSTAEVDATINPRGFETKYWVEYGPTLSYGSIAPLPAGNLPAGNTSQSVKIQLSGLERIVYHFRVIAESKWGQTATNDQTFNFYPPPCPNAVVRQQTNSQYLPDCRAYELVTPAEQGGVTLVNAPWAPDPYATSPTRFAYGGYLGQLPGTDASNSLSADTYISTRTNSGWVSHYVGVPGSLALGDSSPVPSLDFSKFFDFLEGEGFEGVKQPNNRVPYIWDSEGNLLERWPANFESIPGALENEGAWQPSPDLSHLAFSSSNVDWTLGQTGEEGQTAPPGSAYDYNVATKTTKLISLDEAGNPITQEPGNAATKHEFIVFPGNSMSYAANNEPKRGFPRELNPSVSTDGSHILMSTSSAPYEYFTHPFPPKVLYMRVNDAVTYEVSDGHAVNYVGMTADGTKVFFTSPERLTSEDTDESVDLYMWSEAGNKLTLLSAGPEGIGNAGNENDCEASSWTNKCNIIPVQTKELSDNAIAAESGEIYFFSPEQLEGARGVPDKENLYVYRNGKPEFVAALTPKAAELEREIYGPISRIQVSPDGKHSAFITGSKLTNYENHNFEEMYTYEPATEQLRCASCIPSGAAPHYDVTGSKAGLFMSNDGRTFFETIDPLVAQDTNKAQDVYEFVDGRPQLISSGTGTHSESIIEFGGSGNVAEEGLAGVSANGQNVYFSAREELVPQDKNGQFLVFYDARVGGGFPYEPPLAPCEAADECHGEGSAAPGAANVASETDMGSRGNAPNPAKKKNNKKHKKKSNKKKSKKKHKSAKKGRASAAKKSQGDHRNA